MALHNHLLDLATPVPDEFFESHSADDDPMFIKRKQPPWVEFSAEDGRLAPALVHYFSDRCDPFKSVLPQLVEAVGGDVERVFVIESPLSGIVDETIELHRESAWPDQVVVGEHHRAFFDAVKVSLAQALAKLEQIEFAVLNDNTED